MAEINLTKKTDAVRAPAQLPSISSETVDELIPVKAKQGLRELGQGLAKDINSMQSVKDVKGAKVFRTGVNVVGKNVARILKFGGFLGTTASVLFYFLTSLKIVSAFFAIPAFLSFGLAHFINRSIAQNSKNDLSKKDPLELLENARDDSSLLESNGELNRVIKAMDYVKDLDNADPQKAHGVNLIKAIKYPVLDKISQEKYNYEDMDSEATMRDYQKFLNLEEQIMNEYSGDTT